MAEEKMNERYSKIKAEHLNRIAFVYIRQSSLKQVEQHKEGRLRQYQLVDWAMAAGWPKERVIIIDRDQGKSSASPNARDGFAELVAAVGRGQAGIVIALEATRLARNSPDWHHLVYMCRWTETLIADEHTVYDPGDSSDRMVLGIRGQMSEMELENSIGRMFQARWNKARRGELVPSLPAGYELDELGHIVVTPDESVAHAIRTVFTKFDELGSARQVYIWWKTQGMKFPVRRIELHNRPVVWLDPLYAMFLRTLRHPVYSGAYVFGRMKTVRTLLHDNPEKIKISHIRQNEYRIFIKDHHPGFYFSRKFAEIQAKIEQNMAMRNISGNESGAVREGPALLQGLTRCGRCGRRMYVSYGGNRKGQNVHVYQYRCAVARQRQGEGRDCQIMGAKRIDLCVIDAFLEVMRSGVTEAARMANDQKRIQSESIQKYWELQIEKAEYEAKRAQRAYEATEPENRLVARELEKRWNDRLSELEQVRVKASGAITGRGILTEAELSRVSSLVEDLQAVWDAPTSNNRDKKRLLRCLIEEVQLRTEPDHYGVKIVWKGGSVTDRKVIRLKRGPVLCYVGRYRRIGQEARHRV